MKKKLVWAFALLLAVSLSGEAQERQERGEQHDKLNIFVGEWKTFDKVLPNPSGPGGESEGTALFHWMLGDFWLAHEYTGEMPDYGHYEGLGITTYDPAAGNYVTYWFGNSGAIVGQYRGDWVDGKSLVLNGATDMEGVTIYERMTWTPVSENEIHFTIEMSLDDKEYVLTLDSTYRR